MKIALAGNPNSGKTTFFNAMTGKTAHVGNWPGVTVDVKEGVVKKKFRKGSEKITVVDLPGVYSLSPFTNEEILTRSFIKQEKPDVIINIVDATNLSRSLFLTSQLLELGIPVILAPNKDNLNKKKGVSIDTDILSEKLKCKVIKINALKADREEFSKLIDAVKSISGKELNHSPLCTPGAGKRHKHGSNGNPDRGRFRIVKQIASAAEKRDSGSDRQSIHDKADRIITGKWLGIPVFIGVIWLVFSISQAWAGPFLADLLTGLTDNIYNLVGKALSTNIHPVIRTLLLDGIIGGLSALVGFLPLIMVLFFCLAVLEDCGYMSRVAVVMDRLFKKIGLSGRSIIPMVVGTGCAIPGIMSTRTIKNDRQRRTTVMLTPFMPCGAKLPVIALVTGVFFSGNIWIGTSIYFLAITVIILSGLLIRKITGDNTQSYFILELPDYRVPGLKRVIISMFSQAKEFLIKAGTIILVCNAAVHLLQTFNWHFQIVGETAPETSILASLASPLSFLFVPLGFGIWQFAAASITGFIARENIVGTLAVTFSITSFFNLEEQALNSGGTGVMKLFGISASAGLAYLVFILFIPPCFAAIGAMHAEMESRKWFWGALGWQFGTGYVLAFFIYQTGTLITTGSAGEGFAGGLMAVSVIIGIIAFLVRKGGRRMKIRNMSAPRET